MQTRNCLADFHDLQLVRACKIREIFTPDHNMTHPIIASARRGNLADANRLLMQDAGAVMFVDDKGWTAAHYAAQLGKLPVLQRLHESNCRVLWTPTTTGVGKQPAHLAAEWKELEVLQWIAGVDPALLEAVDDMGRTAVSIVAEKRCGGSTERARSWLGLGSGSTVRAPPSPRCYPIIP